MRITLVLLSTLLASCSYLSSPVLSPYKMDIRQGNYITPEMREKLKLGMSKQQVRYVMGTPMVSDAFHGNRWDYIYSLEQRGELVEKQRLTLYFEGDNLVRMDDGSQPVQAAPAIAQQPVVAPAVASAPPQPVAKVDPAADVLKSIQAWSAAWSARDVGKYLASYADEFKPIGMSKAVWAKQRRERISKAHSIAVEVSDLSIELRDDSHASATFRQAYRSDTHQDSTRKTLQLKKVGDAWLIISEQAVK